MEEFKEINDFKDYLIGNLGTVISLKKGRRILKPWKTSNNRYLTIGLSKNGETYRKDIHRLVAEHFVFRPEGKNVVNHIDHNTFNNSYTNLEWVTTRENIHHSYSTMSQVRNERKCKLIYPDGREFVFSNYQKLLRHKEENNLDFAVHSLRYYGKSRGYKFERL